MEVAAVTSGRVASRSKVLPRTRDALPGAAPSPDRCAICQAGDSCFFAGLDATVAKRLEALVARRIHLHKCETLYSAGSPFSALYAVRAGSLKSVVPTEDGRHQVTGYHLPCEVLGIDGLAGDAHECQVIALEESELWSMPFDRIEQLARDDAAFQHRLHRCLAREHTRQRSLMVLLGTLRADQRLASFLLDLSQRYRDRGHSPSELVLRMTRAEIGSYLGAKLETVSRVLSRMQQQRIVRIDGRVVRVLDRGALERLAGPSA